MPVKRLRKARGGRSLIGLSLAALSGTLVAAGIVAGGCGARTPLDVGPPQPPCFVDSDCPGHKNLCEPVYCDLAAGAEAGAPRNGGLCVDLPPIVCDDNDPCTDDACVPKTGQCTYEIATRDNDGDGFRGPRPGTQPGDPNACGDDCDDKSELAYPGGTEVCDGVDNDCNGVVDDGATYIPLLNEPIRLSGDIAPAGTGGLAWSGTSYAAAYTGTVSGFSMRLNMLAPTGVPLGPEAPIVFQNGDNAGGPIVWVGDRYGIAWQDRRSGDYEVYFTLLDESGAKVLPDTRLSFAEGFSINVSLGWTGGEFIVAWQDEREGLFDLYAQRLSIDGAPIGGNVKLTQAFNVGNEAPQMAAGLSSIGVAWAPGDALQHFIQFQVFNQDLTPRSQAVSLTQGSSDSVYPTVVWNQDRYVVAWFDKTANPKAIYGAVVDEDGNILVEPKALTNPGSFRSRYPSLKALGDRVLLVYADDRDQNDGYELYALMLDQSLNPSGPEQRVTFAKRDSIYPIATFGPDGNVGILFRDDREGDQHVFFTRLGCIVP
ncbi:putative metal-binding motif-containing protein [Polyangium sp. 15x6]|uniref:putative metal-binding motif-containing protein n=1 Tax=Polyangium sp. 15x6 TaxID=3042687 RepID=UPI00249A0B79|nr:putative metal-binding motif-containing protein [Polyangium sp. 15x6]MDI3289084.1 putative metal-binding motif-containing protein [Polyangium sp. 15x6]